MSNQLLGMLVAVKDPTESAGQRTSPVHLLPQPGFSRKVTLTLGFECKQFIWQGIPRSGERNTKEGFPRKVC